MNRTNDLKLIAEAYESVGNLSVDPITFIKMAIYTIEAIAKDTNIPIKDMDDSRPPMSNGSQLYSKNMEIIRKIVAELTKNGENDPSFKYLLSRLSTPAKTLVLDGLGDHGANSRQFNFR